MLGEPPCRDGPKMIPKEQLHELYIVQGRSTTEIGRQLGVTDVTIGNWLRRYGIQARPRRCPAKPIEHRFHDSYQVDDNGCWIWTKGYAGGRHRYGLLRLPSGKGVTAHRLSYELHNGPIPVGMVVCHRCDVKGCCNPEHLFLGTPKENTLDALAKGLMPTGERHGGSKLTDKQADAIRLGNEPAKPLAERLGVHWSLIYRIRAGKTRASSNRRAEMNLR